MPVYDNVGRCVDPRCVDLCIGGCDATFQLSLGPDVDEPTAERDRYKAALTQVVRLMCTYFLRDERKNAVIDAAREYVILEEKWQSGKGMFIGVGNVDKAGAALREAIKKLDAS